MSVGWSVGRCLLGARGLWLLALSSYKGKSENSCILGVNLCWNNKKDKNLQGGVLVDCRLFLAHTKKKFGPTDRPADTDLQTD